jgi:hypothetical protein
MLRDLAESTAEIVMERFAAAEQRFTIQEARDAATLYQRFAFLKSLIAGRQFEAAIHQILNRPYVMWLEEDERRPAERGLRGNSHLVRQLSAVGPRIPWITGEIRHMNSLPFTLLTHRTEATIDNLPNRFVKYALGH